MSRIPQFGKFLGVGSVNTLVGLGVIYLCKGGFRRRSARPSRTSWRAREDAAEKKSRGRGKGKKSEPRSAYGRTKKITAGPEDLGKEIVALEERMFEAARNLEFEEAAALRDQVQKLREQLLAEA